MQPGPVLVNAAVVLNKLGLCTLIKQCPPYKLTVNLVRLQSRHQVCVHLNEGSLGLLVLI